LIIWIKCTLYLNQLTYNFLPNNPYIASYVFIHIFSTFLLIFFFKHCICNQSLDLIGILFFLLCPLWKEWLFMMPCEKKNDFPWCYVRCFCVYYKMQNLTFYVGTFIVFCQLPLSSHHINGLTCGFNGWWMLFDVIITNPTCTYFVL
jgi:hypothetical protein